MSRALISRNPDLARLQDDGYEIEIKANHLVLHNVPYLNAKGEVRNGTLVSELSLSGEQTVRPQTHVVLFAGELPHDSNGVAMNRIVAGSQRNDLGGGLLVDHTFSSKPKEGYYDDYFQKMTTYVAILSNQAEAVDRNVTARTFRVVPCEDSESPFHYLDTASSRSGIGALSQKLALPSVAIVGIGGTGAYVLDLVAKTPVKEILLFDRDVFLQHNAFRSPGAPSLEELKVRPLKVDHFRGIYSRMHRGITAIGEDLNDSNIELLRQVAFVFLCLDAGEAKAAILEKLEGFGVPFVDVGMGVEMAPEGLLGTLRVTTSTKDARAHVREKKRIPLAGGGRDALYTRNIQIADLNALNAALAVIKWKKLFGFYVDLEKEHNSLYNTDGNNLINEDQA